MIIILHTHMCIYIYIYVLEGKNMVNMIDYHMVFDDAAMTRLTMLPLLSRQSYTVVRHLKARESLALPSLALPSLALPSPA